ncbi:MAG: Kef-type K+ transport system membrane component KefB [Halioglobus sp.]
MSDFIQLAVIWTSVYLAILAAQKTKLTPMLYFLAFGTILVNIGIIPEEGSPFIRGFGEMGIIVVMFALGFEENSKTFISSIKRSWGIALFGAIAPFITAYSIAIYFWQDHHLAIMFGLAMTATAVSLTMVSLKSEGLQASAPATGIMTAAVLDDIASLILVAILVPLASGEAEITAVSLLTISAKVLSFFAIVTIAGAWIFPHDSTGLFARIPILGKYGFRNLLNFGNGEHSTLTLLLFALVNGILAHEFGFHPAVGAYMAGLILREEYFVLDPDGDEDHYQATKRIIDNVAFSWLGPVFFVGLGAKMIIEWDILVSVLPQTAALTLGIFFTQISSAGLAARYTAGFNAKESLLIGLGMLGRAELAFVVIDIAYVQHSILTTEAFYTLMITAFFLNLSVPLSIRMWKNRFDP